MQLWSPPVCTQVSASPLVSSVALGEWHHLSDLTFLTSELGAMIRTHTSHLTGLLQGRDKVHSTGTALSPTKRAIHREYYYDH